MSKQVSAKVIAHSKSSVDGKEIITFELEFPRLVLCEFNTHNALSKNSSSSRAIPVNTMLEQVRNNPAMPVRFGAANKGMQDAGEHTQQIDLGAAGVTFTAEEVWSFAAKQAANYAEAFHVAGYAKQICNRLIEPFQMMKVVMTATELNNFYWLRDHPAADPTIEALAQEIKKAHKASTPVVLDPGDWHVPYFGGEGIGYWLKDCGIPLETALTVSASCCAQVSYRKLDDSIEKAEAVVARLNLNGEEPDQPVHASPLEHQATPIMEKVDMILQTITDDGLGEGKVRINCGDDPKTWQPGITHMDRDGTLCSGNLKGFVQHRQLVPNHVKRG